MILVLRRSKSGLTLTFSGLWSFTLLSEPVSQAGEIFKPAARGSLAKTACWWAANVHQRPSALSSSKTGWPSGAWDRELGSLEGCTGSNCLGAKHATGRSPILLLPARHAACGGRRNRKRGDTSCNKENCTHDERGGGSRDLLRHHWDGLSQLAVAHRTAHRAQTALLLVRPNNRSPSLLTRRAGHRPPGSRTS